jgi:hypothetical protein
LLATELGMNTGFCDMVSVPACDVRQRVIMFEVIELLFLDQYTPLFMDLCKK